MSGLRILLSQTDETPLSVEQALRDRYNFGFDMVAAGQQPDVAIYVLGYVAEIALKTAYFRVLGDPTLLTVPVGDLLGPAGQWGKDHVRANRENYHSVAFWAEMIKERRRRQGRPLDAQFDREFTSRYNRLYFNWWVEMRYHPNQATNSDAVEVLEDVTWLTSNRQRLWQ